MEVFRRVQWNRNGEKMKTLMLMTLLALPAANALACLGTPQPVTLGEKCPIDKNDGVQGSCGDGECCVCGEGSEKDPNVGTWVKTECVTYRSLGGGCYGEPQKFSK